MMSRSCCSPSLFFDRMTKSSAKRRHLISDSVRVGPGAVELFNSLANSFNINVKQSGAQWATLSNSSSLREKFCSFVPYFYTAHVLFLYMLLIKSKVFPPITVFQ